MPRRASGPVRALPDGTYELGLHPDERRTLSDLLAQLREAMESDGEADSLRRLFPVAYHDDPEREAEYRRLMHTELLASRLAAIDTVADVCSRTGDVVVVSEAELETLAVAVNALRLVLGTLLEVGEDEDELEEDDPAYGQHQLYLYLGWLLECLVGVRRGR